MTELQKKHDISENQNDERQWRKGSVGTFFEINVATKKGIHIFATDSTVRQYSEDQVRLLLAAFKAAWPDCICVVTEYGAVGEWLDKSQRPDNGSSPWERGEL